MEEKTVREILGVIDSQISEYEMQRERCKKAGLRVDDLRYKITALEKLSLEITRKYSICE